MSEEAEIIVVLVAVILAAIILGARRVRRVERLRGSGNPYYDNGDGGALDTSHHYEDRHG